MSISGIVGNMIWVKIVGEINRTRPFEQHIIAGKFRSPFENYRVLSDYRKLYPNGPLIRHLLISSMGGVVTVSIAAGLMLGIVEACLFASLGLLNLWLYRRRFFPWG
jgi:hypothetical protein